MVDDLDCSIVALSTDDDGDAITYTYTWYDPTGTDVQVTPSDNFSDTFGFSNNSWFVGMCRRSIRRDRRNTSNG